MTNQTTTDIRAIGAPVASYTYRLVDADGVEVSLPARVTAWDGSHYVINSFKPSRYQDNPGYVYTVGDRGHETLVPSVFKLAIVAEA